MNADTGRVVDLHPRTRTQLTAAVIAEARIVAARLAQHRDLGYAHIKVGVGDRLADALAALDRHDNGGAA